MSTVCRRAALTALLLPSAALAEPVLEVRLNSVVQAANAEIAFPPTALGDSSPLILVLRNIGNQTLEFTGDPIIMLAGGFADDFSVLQPPLQTGNTLSPNGSTAFRVDFGPSQVRERIDTRVFIFTNATVAPFQFTLVGRGTGPKMVVKQGTTGIADGGAFNFPPTRLGEPTTVSFVIENQGDAPLQLTGTPPVEISGGFDFDYTVTQQPAQTIAAGQSSAFSVRFAPVALGLHPTRVSIANNEDSLFVDLVFDIDLNGQALPAQPDVDVEPVEGDDVEQIDDVDEDGSVEIVDEENNVVNDDPDDVQENINDHTVVENDADDEETENELNDAGFAACGFGIPFGLAGCMLSLAGMRRERWTSAG